jgi:L-threonylcarbamoyladenylate synthase
VLSELGGRIPLVVDGGPTQHGLESTIITVGASGIRILRSGPITPEQLAEFGEVSFGVAGAAPDAPGQLKSHYAPRTPLQLLGVPGDHGDEAGSNLQPTGYLAWKRAPEGFPLESVRVLSPSGDFREAAATLFAKLRQLDEMGLHLIVAESVPEQGLGIAIMDRLRKAAARG